jgi:hypothetical protein
MSDDRDAALRVRLMNQRENFLLRAVVRKLEAAVEADHAAGHGLTCGELVAAVESKLTPPERHAAARAGLIAALRSATAHADGTAADDPVHDLVDQVNKADCQIVSFFHCVQCLDERPDGQSPRDWTWLEFGLTADRRLQVWCIRHEREVGTFLVAPQHIPVGPGCGHGAS